jgi:N-carbamoyl-L-amino-acid hydrolase
VVAAKATLTVDLRNTDENVLQHAERQLASYVADIAVAEGVHVSSRRLARFEPVEFDPRTISLVEETARSFGYTARGLPAGAGHDAQMLARVCPAGMIFVPSVGGISHNPGEFTKPEHLAAGADILLQMLVRLAEEDDIPTASTPSMPSTPQGAAQ